MGMKQIAGRDGRPHVFSLGLDDDGLGLDSPWAGPDGEWDPDGKFMFCLRKVES